MQHSLFSVTLSARHKYDNDWSHRQAVVSAGHARLGLTTKCMLSYMCSHIVTCRTLSLQRAGLAEDLDSTPEEFRTWLDSMDEQTVELRRKLGVTERNILSKKQLIEANKAQFTRVSNSHPSHAPNAIMISTTNTHLTLLSYVPR